ncbi:DUF2764 family protein [Bacteroidota bacterium]
MRKNVSSILQKYAGGEADTSLDLILHEEAQKFLSEKDFLIFCSLDLDTIFAEKFQKSGNQLLSEFSKYNYAIREIIQQIRIGRISKKQTAGHKEFEHFLTPGNPLEEEQQLLKYQWDKLDELSLEHYTDFSALISYKLKLLILLRWWSFNAETGFERFQQASKPMMGGQANG